MLPIVFSRRPRNESALTPLGRDIDRLFEEFVDWTNGSNLMAEQTATYPVDICEKEGQILIDAELPGFKREEIDVTLDQGVLKIVAEHKEEKAQQEEKGKIYLRERQYRRIERSFSLPGPVDEAKVDASLKDGVLHLTLHKSKEAVAHKVAIR